MQFIISLVHGIEWEYRNPFLSFGLSLSFAKLLAIFGMS